MTSRSSVIILEGLQSFRDGVDFAIYLDAPESELERWFLERVLAVRRDPQSFLHAYAEEELLPLAKEVWRTINLVNLREHIAPDRQRADVVVVKGSGHVVLEIARLAPSDSSRPPAASRARRSPDSSTARRRRR